jgi:hypothetical protein
MHAQMDQWGVPLSSPDLAAIRALDPSIWVTFAFARWRADQLVRAGGVSFRMPMCGRSLDGTLKSEIDLARANGPLSEHAADDKSCRCLDGLSG